MRSKILRRIIAATLGLTTAIGVSVGVGNNKEAVRLNADNDISISENTTGTSYNGTNFDVSSGGATNANYYKLGSSKLTTKSSYNINSLKTISYSITTRKFGGPSDAQAVVDLSLVNGSTTVATASYSPTSTSLSAYSGTFTVTGDTSSVKFVIKGNGTSGGGVGVGISAISFTATSASGGGGGSSSQASSSAESSSAAPSTFSVTYNDNGATSGAVPTDSNEYANEADVTVLGNTGALEKTGYVWGGWNTEANGTGTSYSATNTFKITSDTTLYAHWFANHSSDNEVVITAPYLNLNNTGISSASMLTATDGMQYMAAPGGNNSVKSTAINGSSTNKFNSDSPILMGKSGAYLYNKDPFQKDIAKIEVFIHYGAAAAAAVAINFDDDAACSDSYTTSPQTLNPYNAVYTFNANVANARYFRIQVTSDANVQIQAKVKFVIPTTSVTVAPASVTLAPTATQQLTTTVLPANSTDSLSYSTSNSSVATVSNTGLITAVAEGSATITATSGDYSANCVVTVENIPVITPDKSSTSGYTGGSETIGFAYHYLKGTLGVGVQNAKVEATIQNNNGTNHAEVLISFVDAGSSQVYLKDGSTTLATIEVSITASEVTITGMPASKLLRNGTTLNLGSLITVNAVGIYSNSVTWSTSANDIASVTQAGVVTGASNGDAIITVTTTEYPAGAVSCTVTVANVACAVFGTGESNGSSVTTDEAIKGVGGYVIDSNVEFSSLVNCYASANKSMKFGGSSSKGSITVGLADGKVDGKSAYITRIVVNAENYSNDSTTIKIAGESKELTDSFADYTVDFDGYNTKTVTIEASAKDNQRFRIAYINIFYEINIKESIRDEIDTLASLSYYYTKTGDDSFDFSKVYIRFGGFISKDLWDRLDAESDIQGYGVVVTTEGYIHEETIKDWYDMTDDIVQGTPAEAFDELVDDDYFKGFCTAVPGDKEHPAEATTEQKEIMGVDAGDDYYIWTYRKSIPVDSLTDNYVAAAYIIIDGEVVFLKEARVSVKNLAQGVIDDTNNDYNGDSFEGSLGHLASLS